MDDDFGRYDEKGFLDVEWEFVNAGIETEQVREYLKECVARHDKGLEQLTLALCEHDAESIPLVLNDPEVVCYEFEN